MYIYHCTLLLRNKETFCTATANAAKYKFKKKLHCTLEFSSVYKKVKSKKGIGAALFKKNVDFCHNYRVSTNKIKLHIQK